QGIYPELSGAKFLTAMVVRDVTIHLYRISANTDSLTSFERGMVYLERGFADSAEVSFRNALVERPQNSLAWMNLISVLPARGAFEEVDSELQKLLAAFPDNYQVVGFAYGMYSKVAKHLQNEALREKALALKQKLNQLNPAMPEIITEG
ncbi:MAG: tetratricopeptide repeat protein, partial [Candidatus Zixiibacteriota bacterium]